MGTANPHNVIRATMKALSKQNSPKNISLIRNKNISGKDCELALVKADITANKNMVPFDDKSPFVTSGIRFGTPAITTRGLKEKDMVLIVDFIDRVINDHKNLDVIKNVKFEVNKLMKGRPLFN